VLFIDVEVDNVCNKFVVGIDCNFRLDGLGRGRVVVVVIGSFRLFNKIFGSITSEDKEKLVDDLKTKEETYMNYSHSFLLLSH
jgi:hypothetical protein